MSERPSGFRLVFDLLQWKPSQLSSPVSGESGQAPSSLQALPTAERYGLFTFGDKRLPGSYDT